MKSTKGFEAQKRKLTRSVSRALYRYTRGRFDIHRLASAGMEGSRSVNDLQSQLEASVPIRSRTMSETSIPDVWVWSDQVGLLLRAQLALLPHQKWMSHS